MTRTSSTLGQPTTETQRQTMTTTTTGRTLQGDDRDQGSGAGADRHHNHLCTHHLCTLPANPTLTLETHLAVQQVMSPRPTRGAHENAVRSRVCYRIYLRKFRKAVRRRRGIGRKRLYLFPLGTLSKCSAAGGIFGFNPSKCGAAGEHWGVRFQNAAPQAKIRILQFEPNQSKGS